MMKKAIPLIALVLMLSVQAYPQKKTFVLVRHAEKDVSATADRVDPELTSAGRERAQRLAKVARRYRPGAVYSTDFKRTRDTAAPLAARRGKTVEIYDPKKLKELVDIMLASGTKRFLVVGHNNTTPALANILIGEDRFAPLGESEYGKIWIVKLKNGKVRSVEVIDY